jgi:enamine deaminase RidA (YjgF/YER057c/UK114 family)
MDSIAQELSKMGYELPPAPAANGNYQTWTMDNGLFVTSGQLSRDGSRVFTGPIRDDADLPRAQEAARVALLRCLALFTEAHNGGGRMLNVVSLRGFVVCAPDFGGH